MTDYETRIPATMDRFERSIEDGDLSAAAEHAVGIERITPEPLPALRDFRRAVEAGEDDRARTLLLRVERTYEERAPERTALGLRADAVASQYDPSSTAARTLFGLSERGAAVEARLGGLFLAGGLFLNQPDADKTAAGRVDVLTEVDRVVQHERTYRSVESRVQDALAATEVTVPPTIEFADLRLDAGSFLTGTTEALRVVVTNPGDAPASAVTVEATQVDGDGSLTVDPTAREVGEVSGDQSEAVTFTLASDTPGDYTVQVAVNSENAGVSTDQLGVVVNEEPPSIGAVYDRDDDRILDTDEIQEAVGHFVEEEPVPYTDGLTLDTEAIRRLVRWWATDDPVGGGV